MEKKKHSYLFIYTLAFLATAIPVFSWFIFSGTSLIWDEDGWNQYYKALVYYGDYLRSIIKNLFELHRLVIPAWDFNIGEGTDLLNALHYYVIGDPLALFTVFIPDRFMHIFYTFLSIFRMYLAGLSFSALAFGMKKENRYGILAGALSYSFCYWTLLTAARHPYFVNPMIWLPLVILGVEKLIRKERPYVMIFSVMVSALVNFYFFYMIVLLTVMYVAMRLVYLYRKDIKEVVGALVRIVKAAVTGFCLSGFLSIPVLVIFYMDSRRKLAQPFHLFYPLEYYSTIPASIVSNTDNYWLCMGYSAPLLLAVFLLFSKKGANRFLKLILSVCALIVLLPILGRLLNGMSYMTNRWSWAMALPFAFALTDRWEDLLEAKKEEVFRMFICCAAFLLICILAEKSRTPQAFAGIGLLFAALCIVGGLTGERLSAHREELLFLMVPLCALNVAFWQYDPQNGNYLKEFKVNGRILEEAGANEAAVLAGLTNADNTAPAAGDNAAEAEITGQDNAGQGVGTAGGGQDAPQGDGATEAGQDVPQEDDAADAGQDVLQHDGAADAGQDLTGREKVRFTGRHLTENANMMHGISSTQYYWSISNPFVNQNRDELELLNSVCYRFLGYDDRTALIGLSSTGYYVTKDYDTDGMPYGFTKAWDVDASPATDRAEEELKSELGVPELSEAQRSKVRSLARRDYAIFKNDNALPMGYCYTSYIDRAAWDTLSPVQRQQIMLDTAFVDDAETGRPEAIEQYAGEFENYEVPFAVACADSDITPRETGFVTTDRKEEAVLSFEGKPDCETYIRLEGLNYTGTAEYDLYGNDESIDPGDLYNRTSWELLNPDRRRSIKDEKLFWNYQSNIYINVESSEGVSRYINYKSADEAFSSGRHDFTVSLGYSREPVSSITLSFAERGIYDIKSIKVYCVPMGDYGEKISELRAGAPAEINFGTDTISAVSDGERDRLLVLAVPYSPGWSARVDGNAAKVYLANGRYLGVELAPGEHRAEFLYETPFKREGALLTLAGILFMALTVFFDRRRRTRLANIDIGVISNTEKNEDF